MSTERNVIHREVQYLPHKNVIFALVLLGDITAIAVICFVHFRNKAFGDSPLVPLIVVGGLTVSCVFSLVLFGRMRTIVEVRSNGLFRRTAPIQFGFKQTPFDEISTFTAREMSKEEKYRNRNTKLPDIKVFCAPGHSRVAEFGLTDERQEWTGSKVDNKLAARLLLSLKSG